MRIRKLWRDMDPLHDYNHAYSTPLPPPDRVSSTHDPVFKRVSSDSQEPHDHYGMTNPPFVDDTNTLTPPHSCVSHNGELFTQKNQRSFDPSLVMRSIINASVGSNQNPDILEEEEEGISEEKIRSVSARNKSTFVDNNRRSSSTNSADISAASSVSSSLPSDHGSWCEEEKVFPLKKRRISLERFTSTQESNNTVNKPEEKRKIAKMGASSGTETTYGKEIRDFNEVEINSDDQAIEENLMMRCSKVDGARWRCSRRRVEGRSLCKHHFNMQRMHNNRRPRFGCGYRLTKASNAGKDFRVSKKRKVVMLSSILDRTVPLLATGDNI